MADIASLVRQINENSAIVLSFLDKNGHAHPTFAFDGPQRFPSAPQDVARARNELIMSARRLQYLAMWPADSIVWHTAIGAVDTASLHWLTFHNVFEQVPLHGSISYDDLATKCSVPIDELKRILSHAMTNDWFQEDRGQVTHSSTSFLAATDETVKGQMHFQLGVAFPCYTRLNDAGVATKQSKSPVTAFNLAFNTDKNPAQWSTESPDWAGVYSKMLRSYHQSPPFSVQHLIEGYDWMGLGKSHVVDVS